MCAADGPPGNDCCDLRFFRLVFSCAREPLQRPPTKAGMTPASFGSYCVGRSVLLAFMPSRALRFRRWEPVDGGETTGVISFVNGYHLGVAVPFLPADHASAAAVSHQGF